MKKLLIGLTGRTGSNEIAGCGKDTVAAILSHHLGLPTYGFSDPIYDMVKAGFGIDGKNEYWSDRDQKTAAIPWLSLDRPVSLRTLLETLGTEWGRELVCSDLWVLIAGKRFVESSSGMIVKDVRFRNEQDWLKMMGGTLVHVLRPNYRRMEATGNHPSNIPLSIREGDKVIVNDGTLEDLNMRVLECIRSFV